MGTRKQREKQEDLWIAHTELAAAPGHPFYQRLNELLEAEGFDEFVEGRCAKFYAEKYGRPSLTPGIYFRALLIGYFEGIDGSVDCLAAGGNRDRFCASCDRARRVHASYSTISRTRRLIVWRLTGKCSPGCWGAGRWWDAGVSGWRSTRRRWRPTQRCGASCGGTRARATTTSLTKLAWPGGGSPRRRGRTWRKIGPEAQEQGRNDDWVNPGRSRTRRSPR